jgi:hypothetical protein
LSRPPIHLGGDDALTESLHEARGAPRLHLAYAEPGVLGFPACSHSREKAFKGISTDRDYRTHAFALKGFAEVGE